MFFRFEEQWHCETPRITNMHREQVNSRTWILHKTTLSLTFGHTVAIVSWHMHSLLPHSLCIRLTNIVIHHGVLSCISKILCWLLIYISSNFRALSTVPLDVIPSLFSLPFFVFLFPFSVSLSFLCFSLFVSLSTSVACAPSHFESSACSCRPKNDTWTASSPSRKLNKTELWHTRYS